MSLNRQTLSSITERVVNPSTHRGREKGIRVRMKKFLSVTATLVGLTVTLGACGAESEPEDAPSSEPTAADAAPATTEPVASEPTEDVATTDEESWTMPDAKGMVLQDAQDKIQSISGNPFRYSASEDATGQARFQVLDSNWKVCDQEPKAGTTFADDTDILFYAVKLNEDCP